MFAGAGDSKGSSNVRPGMFDCDCDFDFDFDLDADADAEASAGIDEGNSGRKLCRYTPGMARKGFTLLELVIAMGIAGVVISAVVLAHRQQTRSGTNLGLKVATQQNLRAGLLHLERDLRMAGGDLTGRAYNATVPIRIAEAGRIVFSWDDNRDGVIGPKELVAYGLYDSAGLGTRNLGRAEGGSGNQPVAQDIDALDIHYFGANATLPMARPVTGELRRDIRRIQVTLAARTRTPLKFTRVRHGAAMVNLQGEEILAPPSDHRERILLGGEVTLRNRGTGGHGN